MVVKDYKGLIALTLFLLLNLCVMDSMEFPYSHGVVVPGDPFKFIGERLTLFCNITDPDIRENSSMLSFVRSTMTSDGEVENKPIPKRYIRTLTTKSIRLDIPRLTLEDDGNYVCYQRTYQNRNRTIGHQIVRVDYRPKAVESIGCRVFDWRIMTCQWSLGVQYRHPENIQVSLAWTIDGVQRSCPDPTNTSCVWPSDVYSHNHVYIMRIRIKTVDNKKILADALSPQFKIETRLYVEPAPIQDFQANETNSTCILLSWDHPSPSRREKFYVGQYMQLDTEDWVDMGLDDWAMKDRRVMVCGLNPFTSYRFRMSVLPFPEDSEIRSTHGYRSEWIYISAKTRDDVPGISPQTCASCFHVQGCHGANGTHCRRRVTLYWKETPLSERHGLLTGYTVYFSKDGVSTHNDSVGHNIFSKTYDISDSRYDVKLRAGTKKGLSKIPSELTIPSHSKRIDPPKRFRVETDFDQNAPLKYYLHWADPVKGSINYTSIIVAWCPGSSTDYVCKGDINWVTIPYEKVEHELNPGKDIKYHGQVIIGIAAEASARGTVISSGIKWSSCIYERSKKPRLKPKTYLVTSQPNEGLAVYWDRPTCTEEKVFVRDYLVSICRTLEANKTICKESPSKHETKETQMIFSNLSDGKSYIVRVQAGSSAGYGPMSDPIVGMVQTKINGSNDINIIIIIVPGVILFFILLLAIRYAYRKCQGHRIDIPILFDPSQQNQKPSSQTSRFIDRPLPKPPSGETHHLYGLNGLNACMTNHGSRKSHSSVTSSLTSDTSNQTQPLLTGKLTDAKSQKEYTELSVVDDNSFYDKECTDTAFKPPSFHGQSSVSAGSDVSSCRSQSMSPYSRFACADCPPSAADDYLPNKDNVGGRYETPCSPTEMKTLTPHQQSTLPLRTFSPKVLINVGNNTRTNQLTGNSDNDLSDSITLARPEPPSSLPPPIPAREPLVDCPPHFPAPPPPKAKHRKKHSLASLQDNIPSNITRDTGRSLSLDESIPQGHLCLPHGTNGHWPVVTVVNPRNSPILGSDIAVCLKSTMPKNVQVQPPFICFPPPPSSPPSPDPPTQTTETNTNSNGVSSQTPLLLTTDDDRSLLCNTFNQSGNETNGLPNMANPYQPHSTFIINQSPQSTPASQPPILNVQTSSVLLGGPMTSRASPPLLSEEEYLENSSGPEDYGTSYIHCVEKAFKNPIDTPTSSMYIPNNQPKMVI